MLCTFQALTRGTASDAKSELSPVAFLKSLLDQLLDRNVGDTHLLDKLFQIFQNRPESIETASLEKPLWEALKIGLRAVNRDDAHLVIFVDGLDELTNSSGLLTTLQKSVAEFLQIRIVSLSEETTLSGQPRCRHLSIVSKAAPKDHTSVSNHYEIATFLRKNFYCTPGYKTLSYEEQEKFVDSLATKANGSFVWAKFAAKLLHEETDGLRKHAESLQATVDYVLKTALSKIDLNNATTKHLFMFILTAQRPLTVTEMTDLLQVDLEHRHLSSGLNLSKFIANHCADFVVERKGLVRFSHSIVRKFASSLLGNRLPSEKDANRELTLRLLFYAKRCVSVTHEPSFDGLSSDIIDETFRSYVLLEYIVRYWALHFRASSLHTPKGDLSLPSHFKDLFPDSVFFSMLEWSIWQNQYALRPSIELHDLSLRIRATCFGEKHHSVLQSLIIVGSLYRLTDELTRAAGFFYRASVIGQAVLYKFSAVVVACTNVFLTCTETIKITERTEIVTYREEMIKFVIEISKVNHGKTSDIVIQWYESLAQLYISIHEEHHASVIYRELYEIIVIRFGQGSRRARDISEHLGRLTLVRGETQKDIVQQNEWFLETSDELDITDELRISIIIRLALSYEASGEWRRAERLFINLWCRISELRRVKTTIELQLIQINIAVEYVQFLRRIKRVEEASNILVCLWAEYEHHSFESELLIIRIKEIGKLCKSFGLLTIAVSIFSKVWGWFKGQGKTDHAEALSTTILITEVVEEITETTVVTKTKTTTTTTVAETVTREIFETTYTRCKNSKVDTYYFKSCIALITLYIAQENWSEAEVIIKRSLELTWKAVLTVESKLMLTETYVSETVLVATQLAICHHKQKQFERAEAIYLRIYHACLTSLRIDHICVTEISIALIKFYEEYHRHDKVIEIYVQLLGSYRKHLGAAHKLTIRTLYRLGSVCLLLGRKDAYDYYIEIVKVLNVGKYYHVDAFEAAVILSKFYYEEKCWTGLQQICVVLWETFRHHHHECKFSAELIQVIYERYVYVLEFHAKVEFSVLYKLTVEYRETVTRVFGVSAAVVITAMIALAQICEKHEKHHHESVTIYEEVIKKIKTTKTVTTAETETITTTVKKRLSKVYVQIITSGHSSCTHTTIERGAAICLEVYERLKIELGCWHESTLTKLKELILLYKKLGQEHRVTIIRLLQVSVIEIISTVTTSMTLFTAATTLASIYVTAGLITVGQDILHQLHHLIILRDIGSIKEVTINIKLEKTITKASFVFLVAFERSLLEKTMLSYSEIMVDTLAETFLYEQYTHSFKKDVSIEILLEHGAKLRYFWDVRRRSSLVGVLDGKLFEVFKTKYSAYIKTRDSGTYQFYLALLSELSKDRAKYDFPVLVCRATNTKVRALIEAGEFLQADETAKCAFGFIGHRDQHYYHRHNCISYGYKLAELLAGIDVRKAPDAKLREAMLETSRFILRDVLVAFKEANIDFVSLKFEDLNGLVRLLGSQHNYGELEVSNLSYPSTLLCLSF